MRLVKGSGKIQKKKNIKKNKKRKNKGYKSCIFD